MGIKYQGVGYAGIQGTIPELIERAYSGQPELHMLDTFVLTADLASGDTILMGAPIPAGSLLTNCKISNDALGGSCTVNVGWQAGAELEPNAGGDVQMAANATGFFSALPVSSAGYNTATGSSYEGGGEGPTASTFERLVLTSPVQVVIAENAVSSGATGKQISIDVSYICGV